MNKIKAVFKNINLTKVLFGNHSQQNYQTIIQWFELIYCWKSITDPKEGAGNRRA